MKIDMSYLKSAQAKKLESCRILSYGIPGIPTYGVAYNLRNKDAGHLLAEVDDYSNLSSNIGYHAVRINPFYLLS